jgi:hypothetical protein
MLEEQTAITGVVVSFVHSSLRMSQNAGDKLAHNAEVKAPRRKKSHASPPEN